MCKKYVEQEQKILALHRHISLGNFHKTSNYVLLSTDNVSFS